MDNSLSNIVRINTPQISEPEPKDFQTNMVVNSDIQNLFASNEETEKIEHTINYGTLEKINTLIDFFSNNEDVYSLLINFRKNREC